MSFDFTPMASSFKPQVESTFLGKGGGGGNTGYFQQGNKKKDDQNTSIMSKGLKEDILDKSFNLDAIPDLAEEGLVDKLKGFLKKIK